MIGLFLVDTDFSELVLSKVKKLNRHQKYRYDAGEFGRQAAMAAQLIDAGIDAPVLKIKLDGFDTHENQIWRVS